MKHNMSEQMYVIGAPAEDFGVITWRFCSRLSAILLNGCLRFHFFHNVIGWKRFHGLRSPLSGLPLPLWRMVCVDPPAG